MKRNPVVDRTDAPAGHFAVLTPEADKLDDCCKQCSFARSTQCGTDRPCCSQERKDGLNVIFKKFPPMPVVHPRLPVDEEKPDGYLESYRDWAGNNRKAVEWFLENSDIIRALLKKATKS